MARQLWIADKLREWGLDVVEADGWKTRDVKSRKTGNGYSFNPKGVMAHHTANPNRKRDAPSLSLCINGRKGLRGPLCQVVLARSGKCHVIASGHSNHAGRGKGWGSVEPGSGNRWFIGIEAENDGVGEPWPAAQYKAYVRCSAALLDGIGQPATALLGHKEWAPGRKIDPNGIDMGDMRRDVEAALAAGPRGTSTAAPKEPMTRRQIELLQKLLTAMGFSPGPVDGLDGPKTRGATERAERAGVNMRALLAEAEALQTRPSTPILAPAAAGIDPRIEPAQKIVSGIVPQFIELLNTLDNS